MIKKTLSVLAVAGLFAVASCSSEPSDLRPETKVSADYVPPGERNNTSNIDNRSRLDEIIARPDVMLNHDEHVNDIDNVDHETDVKPRTNQKEAVENHR